MKKIIVFTLSLVFLLSSCNLFNVTPPGMGTEGTLYLNLNNTINRGGTIAPADLVIDHFEIIGTESNDFDSFTATAGAADVSFYRSGLLPGSWTVTVNAYDLPTGGVIIATDTETFEITFGNTTIVPIVVIPLTGTGTLNLDLDWDPAEVPLPTVEAILIPQDGGTTIYPVFTVDDVLGEANFNSDVIETGYYYLTLSLLDDDKPVWVDVFSVRIILNEITTTLLTLSALNTGALELALSAELENPFDLTFTGDVLQLSRTATTPDPDSMTISVTPTTGDPGETFEWFLNGLEITVSDLVDNIVIDSTTLELGYYHLTAIVTRDGAMSSDSVTFIVVP